MKENGRWYIFNLTLYIKIKHKQIHTSWKRTRLGCQLLYRHR